MSARARCASGGIQVAAAIAKEAEIKASFRGPRVDRHDSSVCTSHVPSHERRPQTRLFKGSFWSFVGEVGDFNRQRNLRGACPGLGRQGFEDGGICGFLARDGSRGRAPEAKSRGPKKTRAMRGRIRGHFGPLITGLWPKMSVNRRDEERLFFNTKFLTF